MRAILVLSGMLVWMVGTLLGFAFIGLFARVLWEFFLMGWSLL